MTTTGGAIGEGPSQDITQGITQDRLGCGEHAPVIAAFARESPEATTLPGVGLPVIPADHPALDPCPGIGPGSALILRFGIPVLEDWVYCSLSFIVTDGSDLFVATAGHCVDPGLGVPGPGDRVSALGVPGTFGTVTYQWCEGGDSLGNGCNAGTDFALIHIDEDKHDFVRTKMCHWGEATGGMFTARDATTRTVQHFGWGMVLGDPTGAIGLPLGNPATQARAGLGLDFTDETIAIIESAAISGDSGSGVLVGPLDATPILPMTDPQALGVLTHISLGGLAIVQRLDASLERAFDDTGVTYTLVE